MLSFLQVHLSIWKCYLQSVLICYIVIFPLPSCTLRLITSYVCGEWNFKFLLEINVNSVLQAAQRAKEREIRAAAAEKRISAVSNGLETSSRNITSSLNTSSSRSCSFCGMSLLNMTPFYRFSYQYCSTRCVNAHRLVLESS